MPIDPSFPSNILPLFILFHQVRWEKQLVSGPAIGSQRGSIFHRKRIACLIILEVSQRASEDDGLGVPNFSGIGFLSSIIKDLIRFLSQSHVFSRTQWHNDLVGGFKHFLFSISWDFHPSHWGTPSFFKMVIAPPTSDRCCMLSHFPNFMDPMDPMVPIQMGMSWNVNWRSPWFFWGVGP